MSHHHAIGIDVGGTGIKGALVDVAAGELLSERVKYPTPDDATPDDIVDAIRSVIADIGPAGDGVPLGVCVPSVVRNGVTKTAANISDIWIDFPAEEYLEKALGRNIVFLNDADAAGVAEAHYGVAKDVPGLVILTTLGTGIGSAFMVNGELVPNSELGHLELDGAVVETTTSRLAAERDQLDFPAWAKRLQRFYTHVIRLFSPDLIVVGGGVSKQAENFLPLISIDTPLVAAQLRNNAGIQGAAYLAGTTRD
jgi:polyphosphate glucokinase